jgi:hypothetical protein
MAEAIEEILEERNPARLRCYPRVLKRAVPRYPPKRARHSPWPQPMKWGPEAVTVVK